MSPSLRTILAVSALSTGLAGAAVTLVNPTGATQTGAPDFSGFGGVASQINVVNNSGLSGAADINNYTSITHANASGGNAWTTEQTNGAGDYYLAGSPGPDAVWTLNLDQAYYLTDLVFWGYHFGAANGNEARVFDVEFSTDGGSNFLGLSTVSLALGSHTVGNAATLSLGGTFQADAVRITITDNQFGGGFPGGDRLGVGEFKLIGDTVPEPSTALLSALGLLALLRRRR